MSCHTCLRCALCVTRDTSHVRFLQCNSVLSRYGDENEHLSSCRVVRSTALLNLHVFSPWRVRYENRESNKWEFRFVFVLGGVVSIVLNTYSNRPRRNWQNDYKYVIFNNVLRRNTRQRTAKEFYEIASRVWLETKTSPRPAMVGALYVWFDLVGYAKHAYEYNKNTMQSVLFNYLTIWFLIEHNYLKHIYVSIISFKL